MTDEEWAPVHQLPKYSVSSTGKVRGIRVAVCKLPKDKDGYTKLIRWVGSRVVNVRVHRAVYEAFVGPIPEGMVLNHKNGIRDDNRIENLEVVTPAENTLHSFRVLGRKFPSMDRKGTKNGNSKFTEDDIRNIRSLCSEMSLSKIARRYDTAEAVIRRIIARKSWAHVS